MCETEIEALKEAYAALNRNDIPGFVRIFAPEIEAGTYQGLEAVTEHVSKGRGSWAGVKT